LFRTFKFFDYLIIIQFWCYNTHNLSKIYKKIIKNGFKITRKKSNLRTLINAKFTIKCTKKRFLKPIILKLINITTAIKRTITLIIIIINLIKLKWKRLRKFRNIFSFKIWERSVTKRSCRIRERRGEDHWWTRWKHKFFQ